MRSSSGQYYIALDHLRALAAFMVIAWHFMHGPYGIPVTFSGAPRVFPFAILDEGHTGVALFLTLSGYLFARLLEGRKIGYPQFILNRCLRLLPLLLTVIAIVYVIKMLQGADLAAYRQSILRGILLPTLPNGGWSITIEFQYYVLLPLLLLADRKSRFILPAGIMLAIGLRALLHWKYGEVHSFAYWTLAGRIDQFLLGILAYRFRSLIAGRHLLFALATLLFLYFYWWFDKAGGFYLMPAYPSPSRVWIVMTTAEGLYYGLLIAWYDGSFNFRNKGLSHVLSQFGKFSYSFYLLHFFFVFHAADLVHRHVVDISNFYAALLGSMVFYVLMYPLGYLSYRFIEEPFLRLRKSYLR